MQDIKKLILTIVISLAILGIWDVVYEAPRREAAIKELQLRKEQEEKLKAVQNDVDANKAADNNQKEAVYFSGIVDRKEVLNATQDNRVKISSNKLHGSISLQGARIDDLTLAGYREELDKNSPEVVLFSPPNSKRVHFAKFNWLALGNNVTLPTTATMWQADKDILAPGMPVTLSWTNPQNITFYITISLDKNYLFTIDQRIENNSGQAISVVPYGMVSRTWQPHPGTSYILHEGPLAVVDEVLTEVTYGDLKDDKSIAYKDMTGWVGITDKYWLTAMIPSQDSSFNANFNYNLTKGQDRFQADYIGQPLEISAGGTSNYKTHLFAGAKELDLLEKYGEQLNVSLFDRAIDFGWLYFLTKPIFSGMKFFYGLLGNFGLAILSLTVIIKILLFPLANKSYRSFAKMKKVAPLMQDIRERYKDDKMQMNKEIMELYKREKVNPLSGCLPMLIQIPVFFALYKVLYVTIEMRHAPFYGWVKDLSAPDPTSIFNLFGLIPWDPASISSYLMLGIWPILMGITMYIQQRLNPPPADPVQAKVMRLLPWFFVFIFASFPAGLVIYWVWNNTLSIIQQWVITRSIMDEPSKKVTA